MMRPFIPLALATHLVGGLRLVTNVTSKEQPKPTPPTKEEVEASDTCDCLVTEITSSSDYLTPVGYYGSSCGIWDKFTGMPYFSSQCGQCASKSCENANCQKAWCYVSHTCNKLGVEASEVFSGAYWSYFACQSPMSDKGHVLATYVKEAIEVYAHLTTQESDIDALCKTKMEFEKLKELWEEMCDMADESDRIHGMWGACEMSLDSLETDGDKAACDEARKEFTFDLAYLSGFEKITRKTLQIMIRVLEEMEADVDEDKEFEDWSEDLKDEEFNDALAFYHKANFPIATEKWLTQQAKQDEVSPKLLEITMTLMTKKDARRKETATYDDVERELYEDYHAYMKNQEGQIDLKEEKKYLESLVLDLSAKLMEELKESLDAKKTSVVGSIEVPIPEKKKKFFDPLGLTDKLTPEEKAAREKKWAKQLKVMEENVKVEERVNKAIKEMRAKETERKLAKLEIERQKREAEKKVPAKAKDKDERIAKIETEAMDKLEAVDDLDYDLEQAGEVGKKTLYNSA